MGAGLVIHSQTPNTATTNDVKIRQRISSGNSPGSETLLYIKGQRMRNEMGGNVGFTTILQCDLKRTLTINEKTKSYLISSTDGTNTAGAVGDGGLLSLHLPCKTSRAEASSISSTPSLTPASEKRCLVSLRAGSKPQWSRPRVLTRATKMRKLKLTGGTSTFNMPSNAPVKHRNIKLPRTVPNQDAKTTFVQKRSAPRN